ncbi:MAG: Glutamine cyclotransferase [uncultured Chloroflexi bacterium]|uniref:Glutamine cyclotransferase n=1 Tax=uncultured Chloroflexota bacterium TaxID=166587 RepID=A0A6J4J7R7_9CHLR|nr:MAG: Glutamine cyclotransferase [uncultured Chloroflexota bacterium]
MLLWLPGFTCRDSTVAAHNARQDVAPVTEALPANGGSEPQTAPAAPAAPLGPAIYGYEVVNSYPHDPNAFTQGLLVNPDGTLMESTGTYGQSSLRQVDLATGAVLRRVDVPREFFAEGLVVLANKAYQLTWQERRAFVYDAATFVKEGELGYEGEGWGLTTDGQHLILSDGTPRLRFLDPTTFRVLRTVDVVDRGVAVQQINELEYVRGEVWANIWHADRIARIDPATGAVVGWIEMAGLLPAAERRHPEAVLNGIAYDEANDRLFVTGKLWPRLFEIRVRQAS